MIETIGPYTVTMTEHEPYSICVFKNGQPLRDAFRRFFDRNIAMRYFEKICETFEKEVGL